MLVARHPRIRRRVVSGDTRRGNALCCTVLLPPCYSFATHFVKGFCKSPVLPHILLTCDRTFWVLQRFQPKSVIRVQGNFVLLPCRLAATFAEGVAGYAETKRQTRCRQQDERAWKTEERQPNPKSVV